MLFTHKHTLCVSPTYLYPSLRCLSPSNGGELHFVCAASYFFREIVTQMCAWYSIHVHITTPYMAVCLFTSFVRTVASTAHFNCTHRRLLCIHSFMQRLYLHMYTWLCVRSFLYLCPHIDVYAFKSSLSARRTAKLRADWWRTQSFLCFEKWSGLKVYVQYVADCVLPLSTDTRQGVEMRIWSSMSTSWDTPPNHPTVIRPLSIYTPFSLSTPHLCCDDLCFPTAAACIENLFFAV